MEPTTPAAVSVSDAKKVMRLVDKLEELEDLQNVYHAMDITEEIAPRSTNNARSIRSKPPRSEHLRRLFVSRSRFDAWKRCCV